MKLAVFNGSPRGETGNTKIMVDHFLAGFTQNVEHTYEIAYLNKVGEQECFADLFQTADAVFIAFPLYTDAMPAIVKTFIESLPAILTPDCHPSLFFLVQSGFPEGIHAVYVEKYLRKLAKRLGCPYLGTVIKGNGESTRYMPPAMTQKLFTDLTTLGEKFGREGALDETIIIRLRQPLYFPWYMRLLMSLIKMTGLVDLFWNQQLKENGAFERRRARPFASKVNAK